MSRAEPISFPAIPLAEIAESQSPIVYGIVQPGPHIENGVPFVQSRDVGSGINLMQLQNTSQDIADSYKRSRLKTGDILFSLRGDIGASSITPPELDGANIARGIARIRVRADHDREYVRFALQAPLMRRMIARRANGSTFRELSIEEIRRLQLPLPPLGEQRKIAEILRTWDEAIEKLEALRDVKERRLEGLVARMIHGAQDELRHLRDYVTEISLRNKGQKITRVLSVTNATGFVLAEDQFAHRVASADISNYKIVRRGHYAYNPSRINVGSIARLDDWEEGALSPMYVVFETGKGLNSDYFLHWLRSAEARQRIALSAQGSVRETVSFGDFSSILIPIPPIEDQRQIAQALNLAREEIALIDEEITALQRQKRGLMQKLLTGEWRVQC